MNDNQQFDDILDQALGEYRQAEPLSGIEDRVLQRLRLQSEQRRTPWLRWGAVAACAVLLAIVVWLGWRGHDTRTEATRQPAKVPSTVAPAPTNTPTQSARESSDRAAPRSLRQSQAKSSPPVSAHVASADTRSAQALIPNHAQRQYPPQPVPLTLQERQLLALAQTHPDVLRAISVQDDPIKIAPLTIKRLPSEANQNGDD